MFLVIILTILTRLMSLFPVLQRDVCGETSIRCSDVPACDGTTVVGWYSRPPYMVLACSSSPAAAEAQQIAAARAMARAGFLGPQSGALHFYRRQLTAVSDIREAQATLMRELSEISAVVFKYLPKVAMPRAAPVEMATSDMIERKAYFDPVESIESGTSCSHGGLNGDRLAQAYHILFSSFPLFFPELKSFSAFALSRKLSINCTMIVACLERFDSQTGVGNVVSACVVFVYANAAVIPFFGTKHSEQGQGWGRVLVNAIKAKYHTTNGKIRRIVKVDVAESKEGFWAKCGMQRMALTSAMAKQIVGTSASGRRTQQIFSMV